MRLAATALCVGLVATILGEARQGRVKAAANGGGAQRAGAAAASSVHRGRGRLLAAPAALLQQQRALCASATAPPRSRRRGAGSVAPARGRRGQPPPRLALHITRARCSRLHPRAPAAAPGARAATTTSTAAIDVDARDQPVIPQSFMGFSHEW